MTAPLTARPLVAYKSDPVRGAIWHDIFTREAPDLRLLDWAPEGEAADAPYLVAWTPPGDLPRAMPNLDVLFCIGAGIDHLPVHDLPQAVQVVRMVDPNLTASMVEYVVMAVLALHRDLPFYPDRAGCRALDPAAGAAGSGAPGRHHGSRRSRQAAAQALRSFGFPIRGWSASSKSIDGSRPSQATRP